MLPKERLGKEYTGWFPIALSTVVELESHQDDDTQESTLSKDTTFLNVHQRILIDMTPAQTKYLQKGGYVFKISSVTIYGWLSIKYVRQMNNHSQNGFLSKIITGSLGSVIFTFNKKK